MADDRNEGLDRTKEPAVRVERAEDTAWITLNRPRVFNAFDEAMLHEMWEALRGVTLDRRVRVVVLRGAGPAFCAGGDLRAIMEHFPEAPGDGFHRLAAVFHQCILELRQMPKPVIAALHGPAAGGGFSMALACDLRLMAESAVLRLAYTSSGLCVDGGGTFNLPRLVGTAKALELALLDGKIDAETAARLGLVTRVVPDGALRDEVERLAARLARMPTATLGRVKALFNDAHAATLPEQLERERHGLAATANHPEGREGLRAFVDKRKPVFPALSEEPGSRREA